MKFVKSDHGYTNLDLVALVMMEDRERCLLVGVGGKTIDMADLDAVLLALGVTVGDPGR
jgi:hypothetical protein